jgi:PAS domain S-box-containing protein
MEQDRSLSSAAGVPEAELQFRAMADLLPQLVWLTDRHGGTIWYNRRWHEFTGATLEEMEGWGWTTAVHPDHAARVTEGFRRAWDAGADWEDTYPLRRFDGEYRWFLSRAAPLRNAEGRLIRWFGTNTDITDRIEAERLQELLTQEISHRVKNNLALISSLLTMQAREVEGQAREAIREAALRVSTVAQLYDLFWRSTAESIDLSQLVGELCHGLQETWPVHPLRCEAEPIEVHPNKAIPLALIVNELVTNAFKHAYGDTEEGEVRVSLKTTPSGELRLEVRDFGRGLPQDFDLAEAQDSLGMRVLTALARQLKGSLHIERVAPGACFVLQAPSDAGVGAA